jgi:DNA transformation protein
MAHEELAQQCVELFEPLGRARSRRMFGGHGIYIDDLFVAIVMFDRIYLKADDASRPAFKAAGCEPFIYGSAGKSVSLGYWAVPAEAAESPAQMQPWARLAIEAALRARALKTASTRCRPKAAELAPTAKPRKPKAAAARDQTPTRRR